MNRWWMKLLLSGVVVLSVPFISYTTTSGYVQVTEQQNSNEQAEREDASSFNNSEAVPDTSVAPTPGSQTPDPSTSVTAATRQTPREVADLLDPAVLVNKQQYLPREYEPTDLVQPNITFSFPGKSPKKLMRKEAAAALEKLFNQAKQEHIRLVGVSAYRSYDAQMVIYRNNVRTQGEETAKRVSAGAGYSEHQTGLAIDVSTPNVGNQLETTFGNSEEGKWLAANAQKFGFIIRYPIGKEDVTGYTYEPWHIRYVGVKAAEEIAGSNTTLEEYWQKK